MKRYLVLLAVFLSFLMAQTALADTVNWNLEGGVWTLGTVTGNFTYDTSSATITNWEFTITYNLPYPYESYSGQMTNTGGGAQGGFAVINQFTGVYEYYDLIFANNDGITGMEVYLAFLLTQGSLADLTTKEINPVGAGYTPIFIAPPGPKEWSGYLSAGELVATPVPVPPSARLLGSGLLGLGAMGWRRRKKESEFLKDG